MFIVQSSLMIVIYNRNMLIQNNIMMLIKVMPQFGGHSRVINYAFRCIIYTPSGIIYGVYSTVITYDSHLRL
jgi:hypothetical protein